MKLKTCYLGTSIIELRFKGREASGVGLAYDSYNSAHICVDKERVCNIVRRN